MKLEIEAGEHQKLNLLTKITFLLLGILLAATILAISLKILGVFGITAALLLITILCYYAFKLGHKNGYRHFIAYGMILSILLTFIGYLVSLNLIGKVEL